MRLIVALLVISVVCEMRQTTQPHPNLKVALISVDANATGELGSVLEANVGNTLS